MPRKKKKRSRSRRRKKKKSIKRPYRLDKVSRARHAHRRRRHRASAVRLRDEAEMTNYLLNQLLKTAASTEGQPYNYDPRHHTKDPEFAFSTPERREFKQGFPASDTHFWRPQGTGMPPSRGNFPGWEPQWEHTYQHPHAV